MDPVILYALGGLLLLFAIPAIPVAFYLRARDKRMEREGKTPEQIEAATHLAEMFHSVAQRCIPGAVVMVGGAGFAVHFYAEHDSGWWWGLLMIAAGWFLVRLLARKAWLQYQETRRFVERGPYEYE